MKHFVRHIILFLMIATVTGCYDEFMKEEIIGEGKASKIGRASCRERV